MSEIHLKRRSDLHLVRKIWHVVGVLSIIVIFHNVSRAAALQLITFFAFLFVVTDILRQQIKSVNNFVTSIFHPIMRESERNSIAGTSYLFLGVFVIILLFPKDLVVLALLFLGFADPIASYVGIMYGKDKIVGQKSLQGTLAAFFVCTLISFIYYFSHNLMVDRLLIVSILSGLIGAVAELIPLAGIDDNFSFPVLSSAFLWFVFYLFGGF